MTRLLGLSELLRGLIGIGLIYYFVSIGMFKSVGSFIVSLLIIGVAWYLIGGLFGIIERRITASRHHTTTKHHGTQYNQ